MERTWEPLAGGASSLGEGYLWIEETIGPLGNLYAVAEGAHTSVGSFLKALRDDYFGEPTDGGLGDTLASLRGAVEAAQTLVLRHSGLAPSCIVAAVQPSGALILTYRGSCQAFLYRERDRTFERLTTHHALPDSLPFVTDDAAIEQEYRQLQEGDVVLLTSAAVTDVLPLRELEAWVHQARSLGPQATAARVVQQAQELDPMGQATALVLTCPEMETKRGASPRAQRAGGALPSSLHTAQGRLAAPDTALGTDKKPPSSRPALRFLSRRRPIALGLLVVILLGSAGGWLVLRAASNVFPGSSALLPPSPLIEPSPLALASLPERSPTPSPELTALPFPPLLQAPPGGEPVMSAAERSWQRVNFLWEQGDTGNVAALQEIVALLEQLQVQTPQDAKVDEKLRVARINLSYRQKMQEIATYWGRGETSAETVASWGRIVEILEAIYRIPLPETYAKATKDKLYAAHVNYGRALEASQRFFEARGQYQQAQQIDPGRPEARDALARYRP